MPKKGLVIVLSINFKSSANNSFEDSPRSKYSGILTRIFLTPLQSWSQVNLSETLQSLIYPVLSLPFDVTSEIFINCLSDIQEAEPPVFDFSLQKLPTPLVLSQICRSWRDVALKTPKIWACFRICVEDWPEDRTPRLRRLAEWVERAGASPLSFILHRHARFAYSRSTSSDEVAILLPILALSMQWKHVDLRLSYQDLITTEQFPSDLHGRLPALEKLQIRTADSGRRDSGTTMVTAFELAPNLRTVVLEQLRPVLILLPWIQLTHFTGERVKAMDCVYVLRLATSLVECKLTGVEGWDLVEISLTLLPPHSSLKVLQLTGSSLCRDILNILTLPSLVELDILGTNISESHQEFASYLSRSLPPLQHLSLYYGGYLCIVHGFPFLPNLAVLNLADLTVAEMSDFLERLRARDSAPFLPNLQSLVITGSESEAVPSALNYGLLADALDCRWNRADSGPRLESFKMTWTRYGTNVDYPLLRRSDPPPDFRLSVPRLLDMIDEADQRLSWSLVIRRLSLSPNMQHEHMEKNQSLRDRLAEIDTQIALLDEERQISQKAPVPHLSGSGAAF
ncbi:F-box domain-containing protein [Mycena venus]|uniref:F-box domain-containing protein n=1 Tax=Mycena venus TaxID=2733690 RepID=A0A8H6WYF8_9AGAR|nr:F-box domain-containing protein [Mycena venus]